ncbi:MAG: glycosyl hydrolase [Bacillota bacterium]|nr:glycosyl hydrolase [Bacillota bacterium]
MQTKKILSVLVVFAMIITSIAMPINAIAAANEQPAVISSDVVSVSGYVSPDLVSEKPVKAGFKVSVVGSEASAVTDSQGFFNIEGLPKQSSTYDLVVTKPGYLSRLIKEVPGSSDAFASTEEKPIMMWAGDIPQNGISDNMINMKDVVELAKAFNAASTDPNYNEYVNFDMDGTVSMQDVVILAKHFGATPADYPMVVAVTPTPTDTPTSTPTPTATPTSTPSGNTSPKTDINIYKDSLLTGWQDWSWTSDRDLANTEVAKSGSSIAVTYTAAWAALSLYSSSKIDTAGYDSVDFWINGGDSDKTLGLYCIKDATDDTTESAKVQFTAKAGVWTEVKVKLSELGNPETIQRINIQELSGAAQTTIYIDDVTLVAVPAPASVKTLTIYDDALASGLQNWSWGSTVDFASTSTVKSGSNAISLEYTGAWAALSIYSGQVIKTAGYDYISFWVNGGDSDKKLGFSITRDAADDTSTSPTVQFTAKAGQWTEVKVNMSDLANPEAIQRINIQELSGAAQTPIYIDDLSLVGAAPVTQTKVMNIYNDAMPDGFQNWSWNTTADFADSNAKVGSAAIAITYTGAYAALSLYSSQRINTTGYNSVKFWVNGGDSDKKLAFSIVKDAADETSTSPQIMFTAKAGVWTEITVKLSDLGDPEAIQRINIQEMGGAPQTTIYVDEIRLEGDGSVTEPKATPVPDPNPGPRTDKAQISTNDYDVSPVDTVDSSLTKETASLFAALRGIGGKNLLFGHQDTTTCGITTGGSKDGTQSDVKNDVGAFPAVYGWDTLIIEGKEPPGNTSYSAEKNIELLSDVVKKAYARGGVITLSSHMPNFVNGGDFYQTSGNVVTNILPGGSKNAEFNKFLDNIATFANNIKDDNGNLIPIIYRPFHENTGSWFWWGADFCTEDQYIKLYRYTVEYLRDVKGVHNFLYAYSPSGDFNTEADYLVRYPGDDYVDVLGFDQYDSSGSPTSEKNWMKSIVTRAELVSQMADKRGKIPTITETGITAGIKKDNNVNTKWFTDLLNALKDSSAAGKNKCAYILVWANFDLNQFWVPYMHHSTLGNNELLQDFVDFYNDDFSVFGDTLNGFYDLKVDTKADQPSAYISAPYGGTTLSGPTTVKAKVFANGKTVSSVVLKTDESADIAMTKDTDGQYSAVWTPTTEMNGTDVNLTVVVSYTDGASQKDSISVKVSGDIPVKQFTFDSDANNVSYEGAYASEGASVTADVYYDKTLKAVRADAKFTDDGDSSDWTYQELKVKLQGINSSVDMSKVNKVSFDILLPEAAKDTLFKPYAMINMPAAPGYKKFGEGALEIYLQDFKQDAQETGTYGKMYRYTVTVDLEDKTATDLIMAFVAFDWNYDGPIFFDNVSFSNTVKS